MLDSFFKDFKTSIFYVARNQLRLLLIPRALTSLTIVNYYLRVHLRKPRVFGPLRSPNNPRVFRGAEWTLGLFGERSGPKTLGYYGSGVDRKPLVITGAEWTENPWLLRERSGPKTLSYYGSGVDRKPLVITGAEWTEPLACEDAPGVTV